MSNNHHLPSTSRKLNWGLKLTYGFIVLKGRNDPVLVFIICFQKSAQAIYGFFFVMMLNKALFLIFPIWVSTQTTSTTSPIISLPWHTYTATTLPTSSGLPAIYKFENVRFADAPTGSMRFGAPSVPNANTPPDPTGAISCHAVDLTAAKGGLGVPFPGAPRAGAGPTVQTEDCLFLDIYVPASVLTNGVPEPNTPVVVWFYGGAYVGGVKNGPNNNNPLYTGVGAINAAAALGQNVIFVAGNYRLGAFGWLAGSYIETVGNANAGLLDQRFLLEWVQKYIGQVGGDAAQVSAWGESAGAGSILHHLVLNGGKTAPLFSKAMLQSPAYEIAWDRSGTLNDTYTQFASVAAPNCPSHDIKCLRKLPLDDPALSGANTQYILKLYQSTGLIAFGPAVDGGLIQRLPVNEFTNGLFWQKLQSILVSHVDDEAGIFVPSWVTTEALFNTFIGYFIPEPSLGWARQAIISQYPSSAYGNDQQQRLNAVIRDASFTCNTRQLFDAYSTINTPAYMLRYSVDLTYLGFVILKAIHGSDLASTFWNAEVDFAQFLMDLAHKLGKTLPETVAKNVAKFFAGFAPIYQSYLVSHALTGDPNKGNKVAPAPWPTATSTPDGTKVGNVMQAQSSTPRFHTIVDDINTSNSCNFWKDLAAKINPASSSNTQGSSADGSRKQPQKPLAGDVNLEL
ncbi:MAG: hypothetical protein Q9218_007341 [Villophora microphyllina]